MSIFVHYTIVRQGDSLLDFFLIKESTSSSCAASHLENSLETINVIILYVALFVPVRIIYYIYFSCRGP